MTNLPIDEIQRLYRFALRMTHDHHLAEDIVQEAVLRAWRKRRRLHEPRAFRVWLFQIAANIWRDRLRRADRPAARTTPLATDDCSEEQPPEQVVSQREQMDRVIRAMDALPPRQRQVLFLFSIEELSQGEVARVLGITPGAVKASLSLARSTLRRRLAEPGLEG